MENDFYLTGFKNASYRLGKELPHHHDYKILTGVWLNSIILRLSKPTWANNPDATPQTGAAIFFSVWIKEEPLSEDKLYYNIHALKLRQLKGYRLTSRVFAQKFRDGFKPFEAEWPNLSTAYGPLTLMQGWKTTDIDHLENDIVHFATSFFKISFLIDDLLDQNKA